MEVVAAWCKEGDDGILRPRNTSKYDRFPVDSVITGGLENVESELGDINDELDDVNVNLNELEALMQEQLDCCCPVPEAPDGCTRGSMDDVLNTATYEHGTWYPMIIETNFIVDKILSEVFNPPIGSRISFRRTVTGTVYAHLISQTVYEFGKNHYINRDASGDLDWAAGDLEFMIETPDESSLSVAFDYEGWKCITV